MCSCIFILVILYPPQTGYTPGGHWFARRSFFPVWGRCNFLILLLSADLSVVLPQPHKVVTSHWSPHVASGSFYLSCLYFCVCRPPTLIGKGKLGPSDQLVSPQPLHCRGAADKSCSVFIISFYFVVFLSGELMYGSIFLRLRQYSRMLSAPLNLVLVVVLLFRFLIYHFYYCGNLVPRSFCTLMWLLHLLMTLH